jgi:hypothetical protein
MFCFIYLFYGVYYVYKFSSIGSRKTGKYINLVEVGFAYKDEDYHPKYLQAIQKYNLEETNKLMHHSSATRLEFLHRINMLVKLKKLELPDNCEKSIEWHLKLNYLTKIK